MKCKIYAFETDALTALIEDESISFGGSNQPVYSDSGYALVTGECDIANQAIESFTDIDTLHEWKESVGFNSTGDSE